MAGLNKFKIFNENSLNMLSDADYLDNTQRQSGLMDGQAQTAMHNKLFYQVSTMIWAIAEAFKDQGHTVTDSDPATLKTILSNLAIMANGVLTADLNGNALTASNGVPIATVLAYSGNEIPAGYLLCDGSAVSRTTYAALLDVIGVTYGVGDGLYTFNIPDLRGRVIVGPDPTNENISDAWAQTIGGYGGEEKHTQTINEMPQHDHNVNNEIGGSGGTLVARAAVNNTATLSDKTGKTGGGQAFNVVQPSLVINYIIKF